MTQIDEAAVSDEDILASVFEERAENLSADELMKWSTTTPRDREILVKLTGPGTKLLTGPRGSGKSTLLRRAFYELLDSGAALPVYVNYAQSLALEPLFHRRADALKLFRQWVLLKVVVGLHSGMMDHGVDIPSDLHKLAADAESFINELQRGEEPGEDSPSLGPHELLGRLEAWTKYFGFRRCVLLLDDAAHAFSPEQQREFFEIFRELRSRCVSAKAAVYPGITAYSANFHVGHEAELVEAWYRPDDPHYLDTMRELVRRRLPTEYAARLAGREELIDFLALASFGLPRGFIVMLSQLLGVEEVERQLPTRRSAEEAIAAHAGSVEDIFRSLGDKLPRFTHFVEVGMELDRALLRTLSNYNRSRPVQAKAVSVGLRDPLGPELHRMLAMLEYAGVVRAVDTVSRGVKGVFHRYTVHYALVIRDNGLSLGRSFAVGAILEALKTRDAHSFVRATPSRILGADFASRCTLDLAPCQHCGAARLSEEARFCMKCGRELQNASIYEELLRAPLTKLPLTQNKKDGLLQHTAIRTVQDILLDDESTQIRSVPRVGPVWAARIRLAAEEFVSV